MGLDLLPASLLSKYTFVERDHSLAILATDFPNEFGDFLDCLQAFTL